MGKNKKYSIVLPVRNGGQYLKDCVNSILSQSVPDFNLHILDNNSSDGTSEWIQSIKDDRIIIYTSLTDLTIEENWSRIKDIPRNEFMTIIGHDDILMKNYLAEMEVLIQAYPRATLYQCHFDFIDASGSIIRKCKPMPSKLNAPELIESLFRRTIDTMGTGYLFRSIDYDAEGGISTNYPALLFADDELWLKLTTKGFLAISASSCFLYRKHKSISQTIHPDKYHSALEVYITFLQDLGSKDSEIEKAIKKNGESLLITYARMLSHYLLRYPLNQRKYKCSNYLKQYQLLASKIIPGKRFNPYKIFSILLAVLIDSNFITRFTFRMYKKISG